MSSPREVAEELVKQHEQMLYPVVRVSTKRASGSGTVLFSGRDEGQQAFQTYLLTNYHVIDDAVHVKEDFDPDIGEERKKEIREPVSVEFFYYERLSRCRGQEKLQASIVYYDRDEDLALLRLRAERQVQHKAVLIPADEIDTIKIGTKVWCTGCGLAQPPFMTEGMISFLDSEIENKRWMLNSAASIFGNSGGALYRYCGSHDRYELIGVPGRIAVSILGITASAVPHMGYAIVPERIYSFLRRGRYEFIYDPSKSIVECDELRKKERREKLRQYRQRHGIVEQELEEEDSE